MYDIIVIGGGPAGLTASLYARRAGKSVLLVEKDAFGGQITWAPRVENFPATPPVSGMELADRLVSQALEQGAEAESDEVVGIESRGADKKVFTASGREFQCRALVVATGAQPRTLGLPRERELIGSGVSFCAVCDGAFYAGGTVAVVGGGNAALQEAIYLSDICARVLLIHRRTQLRGERKLAEHLFARKNVQPLLGCRVSQLHGEQQLTAITVTDASGAENKIELDGLFVAVGHTPDGRLLEGLSRTDADGYSLAGEDCRCEAQGIFVAGDCRKKTVRQLTTAVADGAVAALAACAYVDSL